MLRKITTLILLLIFTQTIKANTEDFYNTDKLIQEIDKFRSSNLDSALIIANIAWEKVADQDIKSLDKARIAYSYGMVYARANKTRLAIKYLRIADMQENTNVEFMSNISSALSEQYMFLGEYNTSLDYALAAYKYAEHSSNTEELSTCLAVIANVYSQMQVFEKAYEYIDLAIEKTKNIEQIILYKYVKGTIYIKEDKCKEASNLMQESLDILSNLTEEQLNKTYYSNKIELNYFKAELYSLQAFCKARMDDYNGAKTASDKAFDLIKPIKQVRMHVYLMLFNYLHENNQWRTLIEEVEYILPQISKEDSISNYNYTLNSFLADAYYGMGNIDSAYHYRSISDNLHHALRERENNELALELGTVHEINIKDKEILEQKYIISRQQNRQIALILVILFCSTIAVITYINSRKLNLKNKSLFDQIEKATKEKQEHLQLRKEVYTQQIENKCSEELLFERINLHMLESKSYLEPDISRKTLSSTLNSNDTYLCNAIKFGTGLTFQNYIYQLRLEDAKLRLLDSSDHDTIENVAYACGFNSTRTFQRLFKESYGMTPSEFRKLAINQ